MRMGGMAALAVLLSGVVMLNSQTTHRRDAKPPANRDQENVQVVAKLEDEMRLSALKGDAGWWVEHLSDGYTETDFQGKVRNKQQTVEFQRSKDLIYDTWNLSDRTVHTFNGDTVIVTGKLTIEGAYHGQSISGDYQFTRVWVKNGLVWELAVFQLTKIGAQVGA